MLFESQSRILVRFNIIPPSHCCSVTVLGGLFTRRLVVVSGRGTLIVLCSTGCIISPWNAFCKCIIPDEDRQKTLVSIAGICTHIFQSHTHTKGSFRPSNQPVRGKERRTLTLAQRVPTPGIKPKTQ